MRCLLLQKTPGIGQAPCSFIGYFFFLELSKPLSGANSKPYKLKPITAPKIGPSTYVPHTHMCIPSATAGFRRPADADEATKMPKISEMPTVSAALEFSHFWYTHAAQPSENTKAPTASATITRLSKWPLLCQVVLERYE